MPYMKKLSCIFCLCLLPCILGCDFIYGLLQREGAEEKALLGERIDIINCEEAVKALRL